MLAAVAKLVSQTVKQSYVVFTAPWAEMWNMARVWSHFKANDMLSKKATSYELEHLKFLQAARSFTAQRVFFLPFRSGGISGTRVSIPGTVWVSGKAAVCTSLPIRVTSVQRELNQSIPGTNVQLLLQIRQSKLIRSILQVASVKSSLLQCNSCRLLTLSQILYKRGNNSSFGIKCFSVPIHPSNTAKRKGDCSPGKTPALNTFTPLDVCCSKRSEANHGKNGLITYLKMRGWIVMMLTIWELEVTFCE